MSLRKKKLSGAQRDKRARTMKILSGGVEWHGKRGRPKGQTDAIKTRQGWVELDYLWLVEMGAVKAGEPRYSDSKIADILLDNEARKKFKLEECRYKEMGALDYKFTLVRLICDIRNKFYKSEIPLRKRV